MAHLDTAVREIQSRAEPLPEIGAPFAAFIDRFADAKVILLGESSHGTDEFYRARAEITERLVAQHGFTIVAVEADWPDAARVDAYVRGRSELPDPVSPFQRFPVWMWRNRAVRQFVDRLHELNSGRPEYREKVGFYGLDLYSLPSSMDAVVGFVARHDPAALDEVRERYACIEPYVTEPARYGAMAHRSGFHACTEAVMEVVNRMMERRMDHIRVSDRDYFDALQNARVVAASEAYYRAMFEGSAASWNLRDRHMFETLQAVIAARGPKAKAVVWAHNSHIGDASATGMGRSMGETNLGEMCRKAYGREAILVGFDTDRGTVTAASDWDGPHETKRVRPAREGSWGAALRKAGERYVVDLRDADGALVDWRPERFIGVIYRPETEWASHYAEASLANQFDALVWFEETRAVEPLGNEEIRGMPSTYPFAL